MSSYILYIIYLYAEFRCKYMHAGYMPISAIYYYRCYSYTEWVMIHYRFD